MLLSVTDNICTSVSDWPVLVVLVVGDLAYDLMDNATAHAQFRSCQASLKRYMLALFPRFCFSDKFQKRLDGLVETCSEHAETQRVSGELSLAYHEIASNIITFCRSSIDQSSELCSLFSELSPLLDVRCFLDVVEEKMVRFSQRIVSCQRFANCFGADVAISRE